MEYITIKLTRKQAMVLVNHIRADISYGEGGTFNKEGRNDAYVFDKIEANIAKDAIQKIINGLRKIQL